MTTTLGNLSEGAMPREFIGMLDLGDNTVVEVGLHMETKTPLVTARGRTFALPWPTIGRLAVAAGLCNATSEQPELSFECSPGQTVALLADLPPLAVPQFLARVNHALESVGVGTLELRALRYYVGQGIVPRPLGSPKFARYDGTHALAVLFGKMLQDKGHKLEEIALLSRSTSRATMLADVTAWANERGAR